MSLLELRKKKKKDKAKQRSVMEMDKLKKEQRGSFPAWCSGAFHHDAAMDISEQWKEERKKLKTASYDELG